jgi:two-component system, chemotaxis family, sensor kinase CheA
MSQIVDFLLLPSEISSFEKTYLKRVNHVALVFFALHVPTLTAIAYLNQTGPGLVFLLSLAILFGPLLAQRTLTNPRVISVVFGITAMLMGGLLVHAGQGPVQIEMHFYFFALVAMCAVFANPMVIVAAAVTVALHHLIVWLVLPSSVFNYAAEWWVVAVHAAFVVLESVAACFISRSFFDNVIGLEKIVQKRTLELDSKNRDMRLLLDNVEQGFLTLDKSGHFAQERSAVVDRWFGAPPPSNNWFEYLAAFSPAFSLKSRLGWEEVAEGMMPLEVTLGQMPKNLALGGTHYRFNYHPIGTAESPEQFLVIVTNVTTEVEQARAELERNETIALFERVLQDRSGVESFVDETTNITDILTQGSIKDLATLKRLIHTLKGNAGCFGLASIANLCHSLEDVMAETGTLPSLEEYSPLAHRWQRLASDFQKLLGKRSNAIEVDQEQYAALEAAALAGETGPALLRRVRDLKLEATAKRLQHFADQAKRIADRLDKNDIRITVEDHGVRLDHSRWASFWSAFIHAIRNALDHGVDSPEERLLAGKTSHPTVALRTREEADSLVIEVQDDGRGINWERVREKAAQQGIPAGSQADLERALFTDGLTTATAISDVSGRGVGMGALLSATEALGGQLAIESATAQGTTVRFFFPLHGLGRSSHEPANENAKAIASGA